MTSLLFFFKLAWLEPFTDLFKKSAFDFVHWVPIFNFTDLCSNKKDFSKVILCFWVADFLEVQSQIISQEALFINKYLPSYISTIWIQNLEYTILQFKIFSKIYKTFYKCFDLKKETLPEWTHSAGGNMRYNLIIRTIIISNLYLIIVAVNEY